MLSTFIYAELKFGENEYTSMRTLFPEVHIQNLPIKQAFAGVCCVRGWLSFPACERVCVDNEEIIR